MNGTQNLRGVAHAILTCVTAGPGLGFNRAVLFLADEAATQLDAVMAIGPVTAAEARDAWAALAGQPDSLQEFLERLPPPTEPSGLNRLLAGLRVSLSADGAGAVTSPMVEAFQCRRTVRVRDAAVLAELPADVRQLLGGTEVVCVPLVAKERAIGIIVADNAFTREPIDDARLRLLELLALLAGLALDNARMYQRLETQADELRETLAALRAAQNRLVHSERLATVGTVVARVSHEVRNPLSTIGGFARALCANPADVDRVSRNAAIIVEEVEKLEALLREMLDFTSPRLPTLEPMDINAVLAGLAVLHAEELDQGEITLRAELAPRLPDVCGDREQLRRVFLNLVRNAVQAMEGGTDRPRLITLRSRRDGDRVVVTVEDSGPGIPDGLEAQVFLPFFTTKRRGTGLGLAVVKKIIDEHHGGVAVTSGAHGGACFTVTLPIAE